jgi:hypothetical protein
VVTEARRFARYSTALLVIALAVLAGWITRQLAPPSHIRDGKRLPVDMGAQHAARFGGHSAHVGGSDVGSQRAPSPIADAPLPHFLGATFLALFILTVLVVSGVAVLRLLPANFGGQLLFATLVAGATELAVLFASWLGYGDRLGLRAAFVGGISLAQYAFVAALIVVMIFGLPSQRSRHA